MEIEEEFLKRVFDELFENERNKEIEKRFFPMRFNKKNWKLSHSKVAERMQKEESSQGQNLTNSINTTVQTVVKLLVKRYELEIRRDGIDPTRWVTVGRGGKAEGTEGRVSPWKEAYGWLWQHKYRHWLWQQLVDRAKPGGEGIAFVALQEGPDRNFRIPPRLPKPQILRGQPHRLCLDLRVLLNSSMHCNESSIHTTLNSYPKSATPDLQLEEHLLLLGRGTSSEHFCYCPSQVFAPNGAQIRATSSIYLPQKGALAADFTPSDTGDENILAIITPKRLEPPRGQNGMIEDLPVVTATYLADLWQQLQASTKAHLFYQAFAVIDKAV